MRANRLEGEGRYMGGVHARRQTEWKHSTVTLIYEHCQYQYVDIKEYLVMKRDGQDKK